jgi:hypothetical protein
MVIHKVERTHLSLGADVPVQERTLENASCTCTGEVTTLAKCNEKWVNEAVEESRPTIMQEVDQAARAGQEAPRTFNVRKELTFQPGELVVEGINIRNASLDVEIQTDVTPTRLVFQYEVETRGWAVSWEPVRRTTPVVEGVELLDVSFATTEPLPPKPDTPAE